MPSYRRGFTLIEILVVIGIIGALIGILLPAVQRVRETAARAQCLNNLKQIGLAAHNYHGVRRSFPAGMRYQGGEDPYLYSTWQAALLPFLEQEPLWQNTQAAYQQSPSPFRNPPHVGLATVITLFGCPSDPRCGNLHIAQQDRFAVALTSYVGVEGKDLTTTDGVFYRDSKTCIADIRDGTTHTLLAGERPPSTDFQFGWWYAGVGQRWTGSLDMILGVEEQNVLPVTKGSCPPGTYKFAPGRLDNQCDMYHFWSPHAGGGANFVFADGSVHFLTYEAAPLMPALASIAGNDNDVLSNADW